MTTNLSSLLKISFWHVRWLYNSKFHFTTQFVISNKILFWSKTFGDQNVQLKNSICLRIRRFVWKLYFDTQLECLNQNLSTELSFWLEISYWHVIRPFDSKFHFDMQLNLLTWHFKNNFCVIICLSNKRRNKLEIHVRFISVYLFTANVLYINNIVR